MSDEPMDGGKHYSLARYVHKKRVLREKVNSQRQSPHKNHGIAQLKTVSSKKELSPSWSTRYDPVGLGKNLNNTEKKD